MIELYAWSIWGKFIKCTLVWFALLVLFIIVKTFHLCVGITSSNADQLDSGLLDPSILTDDPSILTEQLIHRSRDIWIGNDNMILNTRNRDGNFWAS